MKTKILKSAFKKIFTYFSDEEYKNRMIKNSIKRKDYFLKNYLFINNIKTKIKIIWLNNEQMVNDHLIMLTDLDYNLCYFINRQWFFNSFEFRMSFDVIVVDLAWNIVDLYQGFPINSQTSKFNKLSHIFVMAPNSINTLSLKIGDNICVMER